MKFSGVILALAAAMPLASAVPFRMGDLLAPIARAAAPEPAADTLIAPRNVTARATNETAGNKRAVVPELDVRNSTAKA